MTAEGLHDKSAIAAELAWRDAEVKHWRANHDDQVRRKRRSQALYEAERNKLAEAVELVDALRYWHETVVGPEDKDDFHAILDKAHAFLARQPEPTDAND